MLNRRDFLTAVAAGGSVLALPRIAMGDDTKPAKPSERTLVLLHLNGGNDGLNTVIPYKHRRYRTLRPGIALDRGRVHKVSDDLGFHPALNGFRDLWNRDRLAVINGVGYPNPNYSHFRATEIWFTAEPEKSPTYGWLGRTIDTKPSEKPLRAIALQKEQPLSLVAGSPGVVTMTDFGRFRVPSGLDEVTKLYKEYGKLEGTQGKVGQAGEQAIRVAERIARLRPADGPFYARLGQDLRKVIALLRADLGLECIQLSMGGYDTHANQSASHNRLLAELGNNLNAYQQQLERLGVADRVTTVVFSEFGRRATENLSGGTDHGSAGPVFVIGKGLNPGFHGAYPSLDDLDRENFKYTTDFRRVYASVLSHAYRMDPKPVVGAYEPLDLFAS
ncbi:MAG: DUF1501 domain-containing protein [Planctomycetota bacterium]|nr:DUF1501 domain-containing protein [Planctomycetota bacterium]